MSHETDADVRRGATLDPSGRYRYTLWRAWDGARPKVAFVMLNPSTADHRVDDPTIRRCTGFARSWGYGSLLVVNLFALRTSDPRVLKAATDPIGPRNDHYLRYARRRATDMVIAWGAHGAHMARHHEVLALLSRAGRPLLCLGRTTHGFPRHPLYLPGNTRPQGWLEA